MPTEKAKIIGISRHRLSTDGDGVTTLVAFHGCPLHCRHCLNPHSLDGGDMFREYTTEELYDTVVIDELYFLATNGGVTFGGGEPAMRPGFIKEFRELCGSEWRITIETSLNVPAANIDALLAVADELIVDIKDMNPDIYRRYTGRENTLVIDNLRLITGHGRQNDCLIRLPLIPDHNNDADRTASRKELEALGFTRFDLFNYIIRRH